MFWEILIDRLDKADCHKREKDQKKKQKQNKRFKANLKLWTFFKKKFVERDFSFYLKKFQ